MIAKDGRLVAARQNRSDTDGEPVVSSERSIGFVGSAKVEQEGLVRVAVKIEGTHRTRLLFALTERQLRDPLAICECVASDHR
ncbi:hypothetical protein ACGFYA_35065 [Streptomyces sp. NPDC048305]|uniref:exo-rhamnogalacturonan lyase family protein n=1 Tax=Streptomyces sp. NPDC048305 TaxID=3365532 RepID=UPI0037176349